MIGDAQITLSGGTGWALSVGSDGGTRGGSLTVRNSTLTAGGAGYSYVVYAGSAGNPAVDMTVENSTLSLTGNDSEALYVQGDLTVENSSLSVNRVGAGTPNADIRVTGKMTVDSSSINAVGRERIDGILVEGGDLIINDSEVWLAPAADTTPTRSGGIEVPYGGVQIKDGSTVNVRTTAAAAGILTWGGGLTVDNSTLEVSGGSCGISLAGSPLTVVNGRVIAYARPSSGSGTALDGGPGSRVEGLSEVLLDGSYALNCNTSRAGNNNFTILGGTVKLKGQVSWTSMGGRIVIDGGSVYALYPGQVSPVNNGDERLYLTEVTLQGAGADMNVTGAVTTTPATAAYSLGVVKTGPASAFEDGALYLWLPAGGAEASLTANGRNYTTTVPLTVAANDNNTITLSGSYAPVKSLTVTGGTSSGDDPSSLDNPAYYAVGEVVTLRTDQVPAEHLFTGWEISPAVSLLRGTTTAATATFIMPASNVNAEAVFAPDPAITRSAVINPAAGVVFPAATAGYGPQTAQVFTVTNTGTGVLTLAGTSGLGQGFEIVRSLSPHTLAPGDTATLSVRPSTGLAVGEHTHPEY